MIKLTDYFEFSTGQRYYHLLCFNVKKTKFSFNDFWQNSAISLQHVETFSYSGTEMQRGKLITDTAYFDSQGDFSFNKDSAAPYVYDLFAIRLHKQSLFVVGFPFLAIAIKFLSSLSNGGALPLGMSFIRPDLNKFIKVEDQNLKFTSDDFSLHFSAVALKLNGDTNITSVNLDGDSPLQSSLYKKVFKQKILSDECTVDKCSLRTQTFENQKLNIPKTKGTIHMDSFGNYKMFLHQSGKNIFMIPFVFDLFQKQQCLTSTFNNPLFKNK